MSAASIRVASMVTEPSSSSPARVIWARWIFDLNSQ
jgi:hypothetical protein